MTSTGFPSSHLGPSVPRSAQPSIRFFSRLPCASASFAAMASATKPSIFPPAMSRSAFCGP
jgi:hypothetical protein